MSKFDKVVNEVDQNINEKIKGGSKVGTVDLFMAPYLGGMTIAFNIYDADGSGIIKGNQKELAKMLADAVDSTGAKFGVRADKEGNIYMSLPDED